MTTRGQPRSTSTDRALQVGDGHFRKRQARGADYLVRHLTPNTPVRGGWLKGLRYPVRLVFWPLPRRGEASA